MPRRTVRNVSAPSSDGDKDKVARPEIEKLAAEEEIRTDEGQDKSPDVPQEGQDKPKDLRKRCPHGRLFQCRQCDTTKHELTPEERARRREKLENTVGQVYNAVFNLAALISGEDSLRLTQEERHGLETTGASTVEEVAPAISLPILAAVGHAATLAGLVAGKLMDLPEARKKKKEKEVNALLDEKAKNGAQHTSPDNGDEAKRENDARPALFRIPTSP